MTVTAGFCPDELLPLWLPSPPYVAVIVRGPVVVNVSLQLPFPVAALTSPEHTSPVVAVKVTAPVGL